MTDLKPCPFCASTYLTCDHLSETTNWYVGCRIGCGDGPVKDTKAEAEAAWNTRPGEDRLRAWGEAWQERATQCEAAFFKLISQESRIDLGMLPPDSPDDFVCESEQKTSGSANEVGD